MTMLAYHNDPAVKAAILAQLARHREADELVQGYYGYWQDGKGCAVGCTLHSSDHMEYETRFGIPVMLARLEDCIFERLPVEAARQWPERLMSAIEPGADLSCVGWKFLHWLLTDETVNPGITHPLVEDAVKQCAEVLVPLTKGHPVARSAARRAERTAWGAASNACSEKLWSETLWRAAWSAESAARAAEAAAWPASADSAERAAWAAARGAGCSAAYIKMSDKLIALIQEAGQQDTGGVDE
jgi:hypothetical protein